MGRLYLLPPLPARADNAAMFAAVLGPFETAPYFMVAHLIFWLLRDLIRALKQP
jgi:hypothetical protein